MFKPTTFGKFYLYEKLAIGGMAEIFKAKLYGIAGFEKTLVVKQILPEYANDGEFVKMFIDEANIAVSLTHGNIVPVYELGKIGDRYYIAMEYVDGENLETIIDEVVKARQEIPVNKAVEICIEVLKGLDYAHKKQAPDGQSLGIVHRDVSPQNVMVSFDGEVKIVDFGIAKAASKLSLTRVGTLKGKFGYMSPEQALGTEVDRRTDVYAAGIVLWEILTGKRLYDADNDVELLRKVRSGAFPKAAQVHNRVPEALDRIVSKALAKEVGERYQEAAQFQLDLQRWLYSRPEDPGEVSLANWMRMLFRREVHPRPTPPPQPAAAAPPPPPPADKLRGKEDAPTARGARREVSFARNSEILQVLEQAEQAAAALAANPGAVEPTTAGVQESSFTNDTTNESPEGVFVDATHSRSISGDFANSATNTATAGTAGTSGLDEVLDWDETSEKMIVRQPGDEYVERSMEDGPIIRVPAQSRRQGVPAPWATSSPSEELRAPARAMPKAPPPPPPPSPGASVAAGLVLEITGDTRKPSAGGEPPLFADSAKRSSPLLPLLAGVVLFLFAAAAGGVAIFASGILDDGKTAQASPSPTITPLANVTRTAKTAAPSPTATATPEKTASPDASPNGTRVAVATERKASFDSIPSGANVYLGSKLLGKTPLASVTVPANEALAIKYTKQGYRDLKQDYAAGTDTLKASERLEAIPVSTPPPAMGRISVQSTPWGEVSIDGVKIKNTPLLGHPVKVGTRKVSVYCPTLKKTDSRTVVVRANEELPPLIFTFD